MREHILSACALTVWMFTLMIRLWSAYDSEFALLILADFLDLFLISCMRAFKYTNEIIQDIHKWRAKGKEKF